VFNQNLGTHVSEHSLSQLKWRQFELQNSFNLKSQECGSVGIILGPSRYRHGIVLNLQDRQAR